MEFIEKKRVINIHNPDHGIFVEGKPGSGKSASIIEPCHYNAINQGMSGLIYDFKGHPMSLGKSAYNYWHYAPKEIREKVQMKFLKYVDPLLGCKTNILF